VRRQRPGFQAGVAAAFVALLVTVAALVGATSSTADASRSAAVQRLIGDMTLPDEGQLAERPASYDWASQLRIGRRNNPGALTAGTACGQTCPAVGVDPTGTVELRVTLVCDHLLRPAPRNE
jgi:hypothetical protein